MPGRAEHPTGQGLHVSWPPWNPVCPSHRHLDNSWPIEASGSEAPPVGKALTPGSAVLCDTHSSFWCVGVTAKPWPARVLFIPRADRGSQENKGLPLSPTSATSQLVLSVCSRRKAKCSGTVVTLTLEDQVPRLGREAALFLTRMEKLLHSQSCKLTSRDGACEEVTRCLLKMVSPRGGEVYNLKPSPLQKKGGMERIKTAALTQEPDRPGLAGVAPGAWDAPPSGQEQ